MMKRQRQQQPVLGPDDLRIDQRVQLKHEIGVGERHALWRAGRA